MSRGTADEVVRSRSNPQLAALRRLVQQNSAYRRGGQCWVEGEHLCAAARQRGMTVAQAVLAESALGDLSLLSLAQAAARMTVLADVLFDGLSTLPSPPRIAFVLDVPPQAAIDPALDTVVLDRVQDAGNAGSILRSAAALGVRQVVATAGSAALWSPKVLRAGMGAHFALSVVEGVDAAALAASGLALVMTTSHGGQDLSDAPLPRPIAWVFGHEGQGIDDAIAAVCRLRVRIPLPGGEESLNVAAAAAICLYEGARRSGQ